MRKVFDDDPIILDLRERYPKRGPNPRPGESLDDWAERFLAYLRKKQDINGEESR